MIMKKAPGEGAFFIGGKPMVWDYCIRVNAG